MVTKRPAQRMCMNARKTTTFCSNTCKLPLREKQGRKSTLVFLSVWSYGFRFLDFYLCEADHAAIDMPTTSKGGTTRSSRCPDVVVAVRSNPKARPDRVAAMSHFVRYEQCFSAKVNGIDPLTLHIAKAGSKERQESRIWIRLVFSML